MKRIIRDYHVWSLKEIEQLKKHIGKPPRFIKELMEREFRRDYSYRSIIYMRNRIVKGEIRW